MNERSAQAGDWLGALIGHSRRTLLERRLFNTLTLLNGITNIGGAFLIPEGANRSFLIALHLVTGLGFLTCYVLSRFRGLSRQCFWPFLLLIAIFLTLNVQSNAGYHGGAHYYVPVALVIGLILAQTRTEIVGVFLLFSTLALSLFFLQQNYPDLFLAHPSERAQGQDLMLNFFFAQSFLGALVIILARGLNLERRKSDRLLENILPLQVAEELKQTDQVEPRSYETATVMFTDVVGFTAIAERLPARQLIDELDASFAAFDRISDEENVEKIKTIGDSYMAVAGVPEPTADHAIRAVCAALRIQKTNISRAAQAESEGTTSWVHRIGVHSGPLYAGVIGTSKFAYDVWGDTVNVASRLESACPPGRVNISAATAALVESHFELEARGKIAVKNRGEIEMFLVLRERD